MIKIKPSSSLKDLKSFSKLQTSINFESDKLYPDQSARKLVRTTKDPKPFAKLHTSTNIETEKLSQEIFDLEQELRLEQEKTRQIEESLKNMQDNLVKKELSIKQTIMEAEEKLLGRGSSLPSSSSLNKFEKIQESHLEIQKNLELIQYKTLQILIEQEKELIAEYRDEFLNEEEKRNQLKRDLSKPQRKNKDYYLVKRYEKEKKNAKKLVKEISQDTEKNFNLKVDLSELGKEINGMKLMVDELKVERENLRKLYQGSFFSNKLPPLQAQTERICVAEKDSKILTIEKLKQDIESSKKEYKEERLKLYFQQESTTEIKVLLKKMIQDINENIEKIGGKADKRAVDLIEKSSIIGKIYDKTFPPRSVSSNKVFDLPELQKGDIESTMYQIQNLYEVYEKNIRAKIVN